MSSRNDRVEWRESKEVGELEEGAEISAVSRPAWQEYERDLETLCETKAAEFRMLGYGVTGKEVWKCVLSLTKGQGALHEMVDAVLGLQVGKFMNYTTVNAYKGIFEEGSFDAGKRA